MPDTVTAGQPVDSNQTSDEERLLETLEQSIEKQIAYHREKANKMEVALYKLPQAVKKLTRLQAQALDLYI